MKKYFRVSIDFWESKGSYIDKVIYLEIIQKNGSIKMPEGYFASKFGIQQIDEDSSISRLLLGNFIVIKYKYKTSRYLLPFKEKREKEKSIYAEQMKELMMWSKEQNFPQQGTTTVNSRYALLLLKKVGLEETKNLVSIVLDCQESNDMFAPRVFDFSGIYYKIAKIKNYSQSINKNKIINLDCG